MNLARVTVERELMSVLFFPPYRADIAMKVTGNVALYYLTVTCISEMVSILNYKITQNTFFF